MKGEILYSRLRKHHIQLVRDEIEHSGRFVDMDWKIRKLSEKSKEIELKRQTKHIYLTTGCMKPKQSDLNEKSYLPLHRKAEEYRIV